MTIVHLVKAEDFKYVVLHGQVHEIQAGPACRPTSCACMKVVTAVHGHNDSTQAATGRSEPARGNLQAAPQEVLPGRRVRVGNMLHLDPAARLHCDAGQKCGQRPHEQLSRTLIIHEAVLRSTSITKIRCCSKTTAAV